MFALYIVFFLPWKNRYPLSPPPSSLESYLHVIYTQDTFLLYVDTTLLSWENIYFCQNYENLLTQNKEFHIRTDNI